MAVSFKVPASPKRSIFNIDTFQGVDLTNTGANIQETRSPNAENMVRYVPGKVRKRTGYHTEVKFSESTDINRALNTSSEYVRLPSVGPSWADNTVLCELNEDIEDPYVYLELRGKGTYIIGLSYYDGGGMTLYNATLTESGMTRVWNYNGSSTRVTEYVYIYKTSNDPDDYVEIRNARVCHSTSATTLDEWRDMPWAPAPEDSGVVFVDEPSNPTIYGCHPLKSGNYVGNRVKNVNRVLGTSDEFQTFTCDDNSWLTVATLGNLIYRTLESGQTTTLYLEFDYISDGVADIGAGGWYTSVAPIENTNGEIYHYSRHMKAGSFDNLVVNIKARSGTVNVQIKNLSVMYEKDDSYTWHRAPEDDGGTFPIGDVYNIGSKNYAIRDSYSGSYKPQTDYGYIAQWFADGDSYVNGFVKISFDLYTTSEIPLNYIEITCQENTGGAITAGKYRINGNASHEHIELYTSSSQADRYIDAIYVNFYLLESGDGAKEITATLSNVEIRQITGKKSYDISNKYYVYHAGKKFYLRASNSSNVVEIYNDANPHISSSWQLNENLIIIDGKNVYLYSIGDENVRILGVDEGYIPLVTIAKKPSGGGTPYESLNMLQPGFYEQFMVQSDTASATDFHLSFSGLDDRTTQVWFLDSNGNWNEQKEGTVYDVDRAAGILHFYNAPGSSVALVDEDNVRVLAYRTVVGYSDRVSKCTVGTLFGVGGAADRLFLTGNPDYPNWDFYSEQYDPTYFPDTGYSALGSKASAIVGYAIVNNYLATFKDDFDSSQAVFIREGDLVVNSDTGTSEPAFRLINTLQGNGVVAPYSFGYLQTEPLFLTRSGVYAITAQDITGEKYSQNRSFYLNGKLTKETGLENAVATVFNDMYVLALNNQLYILDGLQATRTDKSEPYATRQYVGFYCTQIPAVSMWTDEQALWIGTNDGRICRFATDIEDLESYNDDGEPIYCCWETPDLDGQLFYKNKTFRYFAVRMMKAIRTSVKIYAQKKGNWMPMIKEDRVSGLAFDFNNIDFSLFSFSTDRSEKVAHCKVRVKKVDKARFKVENGYVNEPFGLFDLALEYVERGNYKG